MAPFKLIATDLDGTLLTDTKDISEKTKQVLKQIHSHHDVKVVLASGRATYMVEPIASKLIENDGVDCYVIGFNGAECVVPRAEGRRKLFQNTLPANDLIDILDLCTKRHLLLNVYLEKVYTLDSPDFIPRTEIYSKFTGAVYGFVPSYDSLKGQSPSKCLIINDSEEQCDVLLEEMKQRFPNTSVIKSNCKTKEHEQYYVEFLQAGVHKGSAVRKLCELLGIPLKEVLAFGDAENDVPLLKEAGYSICMANGAADAKKVAHTTSAYTNQQDGVALELEKIFT
eukprot:TRINITY_DN2239_c0_g1_i3.p1 TRINITY_DN2239_c0_g1~~TRINITY_DN2239_c0_g1_i3.p1  ORF type:complete len:283 (+),score=35.03 TRINITY_DN2239_c0_g1_i3:215-1063(+)